MLDQIKINNIKRILLCLLARRSATKSEIVEDTDLSTSTVSSCVNSLYNIKLLVMDGMKLSSGGRRSAIYRINRDYGSFIGLQLCPDMIQGVVTDCEATVVERISHKMKEGIPLVKSITEVLDAEIKKGRNVLGIGIGISGKLDYDEQIVLSAPEFGWQHVHLKELIERQYMIFTYVDHPVNAGAIREGMMGHALGKKNYLYLEEKSKDKMALVLDGHLCRGPGNLTGALYDCPVTDLLSPQILHFLGISDLLVGYQNEDFLQRIRDCIDDFSGNLVPISQTSDSSPSGIAAVAQREWFESIYFML